MAAPAFRAGAALHGLAAFTEAERDVLFGRDRDRDEVVKMVTADGFRAGLLYGESGVGKTSLLQAGVVPALRDHGAVVVACTDLNHPAQSFADNLTAVSRGGLSPHQGESPLSFASRVVANAPPQQLHIFVFDDVDVALLGPTADRVVNDIAELFTRVLSRGGGRARVLFACAGENVHVLGQVERRTGSLFPPSSRHELLRMAPNDAAGVLERTLQYGGVSASNDLADAVVAGIGRGGPVLPADLQIAALALRDLGVHSAAELNKLGGPAELEAGWLSAAARATGHERTGMRILGELASLHPPRTNSEIARRLGITAGEVARILAVLEDRGIVARVPGSALDASGGVDDGWMLRHPVLATRIREATAPARAAARRAYDLLGSKATSRQRLTLRELRALRSEQIAPVTEAEHDVVQRSKRFYLSIIAGVAAVPIALLILLWFMNRGRAYYDVEPTPGGDRVFVRAGRAGLSGFHWLPSSPGFGDVVADTGLSRAMVDPKAWSRIGDHDLGADLDGWASGLDKLLRADLAALLQYATTGDEGAIKKLGDLSKSDDDRAELLVALRPIARGTPAEVELVDQAIGGSPALQKAAVAVAGAAAQRGADVYRDVLVNALVSQDPELRRIALTAVRGLGEKATDLFTAALAKNPDPGARRELMLEVATAAPDDGPSADGAVAILADAQASDVQREQAKEQLQRAYAAKPEEGIAAAARLLAKEDAPPKMRIFAVEFLMDATGDKRGDLTSIGEAAHAAFTGRDDDVRAAALPLYARTDPTRAVEDLNGLATRKPKQAMRISIATAWGELARSLPEAATAALDKLIKDNDSDVRAAAAAAYGYLGRPAQEALIKMVKNERYDVAVGAAYGLAHTAEVGASVGVATDGIYQLWKQKGRPRRDAARVYAELAKRKPSAVVGSYLSPASKMTDDPSLHPIGVEGLCNAINAGSSEARSALARVTGNPSTDVRRMVIRCVAAGKDPGKNGVKIARDLIDDVDPGIRAEAARVLALAARGGKVSNDVAGALIRRLRDPSREVRLIAMRALPALGADALETERQKKDKDAKAGDPIGAAFETGDEAEKLALLRASRELGIGDLVQIAIGDASPLVRVEAVDLAIATDTRVAATIATALADADPQVRRAALGRIAEGQGKLDPAAVDRALALGIRDPDPSLSQLALTTLARVADKESVIARLGRALASRTEADRAKGAAAAIGLVERDAAAADKLLTPLLHDPSHDVRVAMLPALGAAWASTNSPEQLAKLLRSTETNAMKRLTATAAFVILARTEGGRSAAEAALGTVAKNGPPMARRSAQLALGLLESQADGITFLQQLVP